MEAQLIEEYIADLLCASPTGFLFLPSRLIASSACKHYSEMAGSTRILVYLAVDIVA